MQEAHDHAASVLAKEVSYLKDKLAEVQQQHADALRKARDAAEQDKQRFVERTDRVLHKAPSPMQGLHHISCMIKGLHAVSILLQEMLKLRQEHEVLLEKEHKQVRAGIFFV